MAQKTKYSSSETRLREAVRRVLSAGQVHSFAYPLPAEAGAQISMTGDPRAWGNRARFSREALKTALSALKPLSNAAEADLERYAERMRFFLQPGDCDRFVAAAALVAELSAAGYVKILLAADTPAERDALASFFALAKSGIGNLSATVYLPGEFGSGMTYDIFASVYGYLTSQGPDLLLLDAASFCRKTNLLRRPLFSEPDGKEKQSLADLAGEGRPAVICCAKTADSARNLARAAEVFSPSVSFLLCAENRRLRDAVICAPERSANSGAGNKKAGKDDFPQQIGF